ncbi:MAG: hypothetical protein JHC31_14425 [Sulfurihydrogenibium sp.]|jgi:hypothetical protein|nr:hypothetical protein [Sulfurihydrogenibium sp.]
MENGKKVVIMRTTDLLDAFGIAVSERTFDVRLVIKDDYCTIQTYTSRNELVGESHKIEVLGSTSDIDGVYRYPLFVFETILGVITKDLEDNDSDTAILIFDEANKTTEILTSNGRVKIDYYHKVA